MIRRRYSQLEPGALTASVPEIPIAGGFTLTQYFFVAVAAGVTVWFITRFLNHRR